ncbi:hypothetical protein BV20DRAFT_1110665, partial [Pilatotrama ljubarskyi]
MTSRQPQTTPWLIARALSTVATPATPTLLSYNQRAVRDLVVVIVLANPHCRCDGADPPSFRPVPRCISGFLFFYTRCAVVATSFASSRTDFRAHEPVCAGPPS